MKKMLITLLVVAMLFGTVGAVTLFATPGDGADPIITLSYIENVLKGQLSFKVVNMTNGQSLTGKAGTEIVLRMGNAKVFTTAKGGVADLTAGKDLFNTVAVPANHHLVVPVADGRGIKAYGNVIVLVKGDYTIK